MIQKSPSMRRALISVFDKTNILKFAKFLEENNVQILSTEGTHKILTNQGINTIKISDYIKFSETMNGRLKTLHHKIYAAILNKNHSNTCTTKKNNIQLIDIIIVNFYPFDLKMIDQNKYSQEEMLEYMDIGGPNIIRAATKNYKNITIITDYNDYIKIMDEININKTISIHTRLFLASKALKYVTKYDNIISNYFADQLKSNHAPFITNSQNKFPDSINFMHLKFQKKQDIKYGENPHQNGALYTETTENISSASTAKQLQGKQLSYNNIIDMDTALECSKKFDQPTCVIVKHANPCGVATSDNTYSAYKKAYQSDPISAFGGIIAFNFPIEKKTAASITAQKFVSAIIAPNISEDCLQIFSVKPNMQVLSYNPWSNTQTSDIEFKRINKGLLIQSNDNIIQNTKNLEIVSIRKPTKQEIQDSLFCWKIVKFVKSNAIVCGKNNQTTGIGGGQTNRMRAIKIATTPEIFNNINNAQQKLNNLIKGSSMASDAFLSFSDGIHYAAQAGIHCIIQPGGSIKDKEIISIVNDYKIAMIFTHTRHFKH